MKTTRPPLRFSPLNKKLYRTMTTLIFLFNLTLHSEHIHAQTRCKQLVKSDHYKTHGTLDYIEHLPNDHLNPSAPIVFALHGLGHHKEGFAGLAKKLPKSWRIIFLDAPFKYGKGRAWYRYRCPQAEQDLSLSIKAVFKTIKKLQQTYPQSPKPSVFGFSQGGVMSMALLNQKPLFWSAVANFSGYWLSQKAPVKHNSEHLPPLLLIHGERDRIVPFDRGLNAAQMMSNVGYLISWLPFNGGHHVPQVGLQALTSHFNEAWSSVKVKNRGLGQK